MGVLHKLNTLLRASARESAEMITDANAIRIYRQEIVDAQNLLVRRRACLATLITTRNDIEKETGQAQSRVHDREQQIAALPEAQRSEQLLLLAATEIAATESHLQALNKRHEQLLARISQEEMLLRQLLAEIREHQRELKLLESDVSRHAGTGNYGRTVSAHLTTLRETRDAITGTVSAMDSAEAGMTEATERLELDPLERELHSLGRDQESLRVEAVLQRLRSGDSAAAGTG